MEGVRILSEDRFYMRRALKLASRAAGMTSPNPMVGAVLVKDGKVIAEDYHKKAGELHAEALVLEHAGSNAKDSTLYVTLEPCCHVDKRTPPCTRSIIGSNIRRVVIGMEDPNPKVAGKGLLELKRYGIDVVGGLLEPEARRLNEAYIKYISTGKPFVILKVAMTLDGKIATPEGQSKWITGNKARNLVQKMRKSVDAILTAIGTVKADNPSLTVRLDSKISSHALVRQPKRIIIDPCLETPMDYNVLNVPHEATLITCKARLVESASRRQKKSALLDRGVGIIEYEGKRLDLEWLVTRLGTLGITSVMIEGGSSLGSYALQDGIVDKVVFFVAPKIIGGRSSYPAIGGSDFRRLEDAYRVRDVRTKRIGEDILIEGYL